jgi:hypothetical protein
MNEEEIYELISEEIESNSTKKGLWTRAFSESEGDEQKAKALYIKHRFDQIKDDQPQTDEENSSNINEEFDTSENKHICYYCSKPQANLRIIFKGEFRQFCNDECYQSCLRKNDLSEKNFKEQQELWINRNKKIKEESLENNDLEQLPEKFGGFLLIFAFLLPLGVIIAPIATLIELGSTTRAYRGTNVEIQEAVSSFSIGTTIFQICMTLFSIYLLYLFYKKKRNFPKLYSWAIVLNWSISVFLVVNFYNVLEKYLPKDFFSIELFFEPKYIVAFFIHIFLLIYFNYSTRVKNTFTQ